MVAEKLRAILQHKEKIERRGWGRSRARDYYDLWRIFGIYRANLDLNDFSKFLSEKCSIKKVGFKGPNDFFPETMLAHVEKTWEQWLGPLVPDLPVFQKVMGEPRPYIEEIVLSS